MSVTIAKVGVGSSSLLSRSKFKKPPSKDGGFFIYRLHQSKSIYIYSVCGTWFESGSTNMNKN